MPPPRRLLHAAALDSASPPDALPPGHVVAQVVAGAGNNLFHVRFSQDDSTALAEMPARLRRAIWVRNGGFVVVDRGALNPERGNKLAGEIVNVVRRVEAWRKKDYWYRPAEFARQASDSRGDGDDDDDSEDEEVSSRGQGAHVGEMPPSESEDDDEDDNEDDDHEQPRIAQSAQPLK